MSEVILNHIPSHNLGLLPRHLESEGGRHFVYWK